MSWNEHYRRRDAIDAVLQHAERRGAGLGWTELPQVRAAFGTEDELLAALQHKWHRILSGHLDVALADAEHDPRTDRSDAVAKAWQAAVRRQPTLHALLDTYAEHPVLRDRTAEERRLLAHLAGLTTAADSADDATRIGGTFVTLLSASGTSRVRRAFRKLATAASG